MPFLKHHLLRVGAEAVADSEHRQANVWAMATREPVAAVLTRYLVVRSSDWPEVCVTEPGQALGRGSDWAEVRVMEPVQVRSSDWAEVRVTERD